MKDTLLWSVQCSKRKKVITRSTVQNQYREGRTTKKLHFHLAVHPADCLAKTIVARCIN